MRNLRDVAVMAVSCVSLVGLLLAPAGVVQARALQKGDALVYAITLELQEHRVQANGPDSSTEASGQGTEALHVYSIGADGTAYAKLAANFQGTQDGKPVQLQGNFLAKVYPDGQIRVQGGLQPSLDEAFNFANAIAREAALHKLTDGSTWRTVVRSPAIDLDVVRRVTGRKSYQNLPAVVIESTAGGVVKKTSEGAQTSGTVTLSGTAYYDDRDHLLIGQSIRILTTMQSPQSASAHVNYSAAINMVLSSLTRQTLGAGTAAPSPPVAAPPQPAHAATATPAAAAGPSAAATPAPGPAPAATVTPRAGY